MSKVYDPILCMLVEKPTRDSKPMSKMDINELRQIVKELGGDINRTYGTSKTAIMLYIDQLKSKSAKAGDSQTVDADKLVKTVEKESGYAIHIIEGDFGQRIVLTFPGEHYTNPHMYLGEPTASNMSNAKNLLHKFSRNKHSKNKDSAIDKAIRAIDEEKGYELDGFWIKPKDYGVEVTKNGKKVGEFESTSEAEKWIRWRHGED